MNGLALCAGGGGLELGVGLAIPDYRAVCYVEREAYAAAVLAARMAEGALDQAPIWDDIRTFDPGPWRGVVDLVSAGIPCQPFSQAGLRAGTDDERWLWPDVERIVRVVRPRIVVLENVAGFVTRGLPAVLGGLADLGYDAEWMLLGACCVGAPHRRLRLFLVAAYADGAALRKQSGRGQQGRRGATQPEPVGEEGTHTYADGAACEVLRRQDGERGRERWDLSRRLAAAADWRAAWDSGDVPKPGLCRMDDGMAHRVDRLRLIGNGVVPAQAAAAIRILTSRLEQR